MHPSLKRKRRKVLFAYASGSDTSIRPYHLPPYRQHARWTAGCTTDLRGTHEHHRSGRRQLGEIRHAFHAPLAGPEPELMGGKILRGPEVERQGIHPQPGDLALFEQEIARLHRKA